MRKIKFIFGAFLILLMSVCAAFGSIVPFFIVQSGSMEPIMKKNDVIIINGWKRSDAKGYLDKPIVFFDAISKRIVVHRAIALKDGFFTTKGDNNDAVDFYEPAKDDIIGEVIYIFRP